MTRIIASRLRDKLFPIAAGIASFVFSLGALIYLTSADHKIGAAVGLGVFALLVCWIAAERPNGATARANAALVGRLLRVGDGDLTSPAPHVVREVMPAVADAADRLFAEVRVSIDRAHAIGLHDPVTGLPNRVHFRQAVEAMLAARDPATPSALMFVDLDHFKPINDNLGHACGDEALVMVAERLSLIAASEHHAPAGLPIVAQPIVARLAGDEFTLFFPCLANSADAERVGRRVLRALSEPFEIGGQFLDIGASIGVATCPAHGCELPDLMRSSDLAMYRAKSTGRGRVCVFDDELAAAAGTRVQTEADLRSAIVRDEFELFFQPQIIASTGDVVAMEALLRWRHPRDGLRPAVTFVPIAEDCGLIIELGDWVMNAMGATLAEWRRRSIATRLAINVSARQLDRSRFFARLRDAMARTGADLAQLELEFTEAAIAAFDAGMLDEIAALRRDGVVIALDDFGSGPSNLVRLQEMPLDRIKIDPTLIADIDKSESARVVIQAVVQLVHGFGCVAVAEGVETEAQAALLRLVGCDILQGHALAEPMPAAASLDWLADARAGSMRAITPA